MDLFVRIDMGTVCQDRWVLNPLFILLALTVEANIKAIAKLFGFTKEEQM